ncbi:alcohol dehydrogenase catalytic domain-containing protein [Herbiconiux moechotypicola]|uniref:Zinc-binding dehydrogenase n=1 Tax=Herbiconiux moechotypicola TaxID=637393 RepID=A0ABN3DX42_9MICO|nr:alcohol dehydrogenase catalytic domain-containing protein [Herbiconiux moechotypicola]MCS5730792.1 alcohol dehydrogenase catalytic domain-containing protein [Herbiconiux moechotypicola]
MTYTATVPAFLGDRRIGWQERTHPEPGEGQLLLAVGANAICGTDRTQYLEGSAVVPGHEAAGTVIAAGPGTSTPVGTRGAVFLMDYCGQCRSCRVGATNQCFAKRADMGFTHDGGYGRYELVSENVFFAITDDIDIANATMLLDVMGTSSHALRRAELVHSDIESIYIAGAGPIGLGLLVMSRLRYGPEVPVHVSDISPWRLEFAESLGAIPVDATDPRAVLGIPQPDVAFDASGRESARRLALDILGKRGALLCLGHGEGLTLNVVGDLLQPEHAVLGSEYFRFDEFGDNLALLQQHQEYISRVITHRYPVSEIEEAFARFFSGESGKVVVVQEGVL